MRLRIALLMGTVFSLAVVGAATAGSASAASWFTYGYSTCTFYTETPVVTFGYGGITNVQAQARVTCGNSLVMSYQVCTGSTANPSYSERCVPYTVPIAGGSSIRRLGGEQTAVNNALYYSRVKAYGYVATTGCWAYTPLGLRGVIC